MNALIANRFEISPIQSWIFFGKSAAGLFSAPSIHSYARFFFWGDFSLRWLLSICFPVPNPELPPSPPFLDAYEQKTTFHRYVG